MDEIIIRTLQGLASDEESAVLRRWRREALDNEEYYQRFKDTWTLLGEYEDQARATPPGVLELLHGRRRQGPGWGPVPRFGLGRAIAAMVVLALAVGYSADRWFLDHSTTHSVESRLVATSVGETVTVSLPDGTVIRVAPDSRLIVHPDGVPREVELDGTAFFSVARDDEMPFRVRTAEGEARVLGTRFEVSARSGSLRLLVVEGRVAVRTGGHLVEVESNELGHSRVGQEPSVTRVGNVWSLLGWLGPFLAFESTPLRVVADEIQQRLGVAFEFDPPELADETVTVWFDEEPLDEVVAVLCRLVEARCEMDVNTVRVTPLR